MAVPLRLAAFAAVLVVAFGAAALAGGAINGDKTSVAGPSADAGHGAAGHGAAGHGGDAGGDSSAGAGEHSAAGHEKTAHDVGGLAVADGGFKLDVESTTLRAGERVPFAFQVTGKDGRALRGGFEVEHDRELHLIVVRRDTDNFQHVHPRRDTGGTWRIDLDLSQPGVYRAFADFRVGGEKRTLGIDLFVAGDFDPRPLPQPTTRDSADGLDVEMKAPGLRSGRETTLTFAVSRSGQPFEGLEPYLGAKGHLVALREGDLAYLHVHPTEGGASHEHSDGSESSEAHANETAFAATFPTAGRYRVFLEFKTGGQVRRVSFTVEVPR
jgi:hypothetical protein